MAIPTSSMRPEPSLIDFGRPPVPGLGRVTGGGSVGPKGPAGGTGNPPGTAEPPSNPYEAAVIRVRAEKCPTCIFHPGNLMHLERGRVADMVRGCKQTGGHIPCHSHECADGVDNIVAGPGGGAICAGFAEKHGDGCTAIQLGERLGILAWVESHD